MTEQKWLECSDPTAMLLFLFGPFERLTDEVYFSRKNLLLACACFSRLGELIPPKAHTWQEHAGQAAEGGYEKSNLHGEGEEADCEISWAMSHATEEGKGRLGAVVELWSWNDCPILEKGDSESYWVEERKEQAALIRDIFGNPFRPISFDPSWLTWHDGLLVSMARRMYDSRDFSDMPVLADALEEAGCTNQDILGHCRSGSQHVRGCWVIDYLLGKS